MSRTDLVGVPPAEITATLRLEGFVAFIAALAAFHFTGGNWWLFAALILAPDLSMLGWYAGEKTGARLYNFAHTYTVPALLGAIGFVAGAGWLISVAIIWAAHIGLDRAIGYGLKYPGRFKDTHLGTMGKHRPKAEPLADAR